MSSKDLYSVLSSYCNCTNITYSLLPIFLLIAASCGLKVWLKAEILLSFAFGLVLIAYPMPILNLQMNGKIDNYHLFLCGLIGCYLIYSALFPVFLRKSRDDSIYVSHFWSKIISNNLILITLVHAYLDGIRWNYKLLCFSAGPVAIALIVNIYHLMRSTSIKAQNHMYLIENTVAKFEFFMLLTAGLLLFAFPKSSMLDLNDANEGHLVLCRISGALLFSLSIESFTMPSFLYEVDKTKFLTARLYGSILELAIILFGYVCLKAIRSNFALGTYLFINMSYNALILVGYLASRNRVRKLRLQVDQSINSEANTPVKEKKT